MSGWQFAGNQAVNTAIGMVTPPITFSVGDVNFSINPMAMFMAGTMGNVNGFSWHTTKYSGGIDGSSQGQRTATLGLRYKDWSISHENDVSLMRGDGGDRFRSAALEIGYKDYVLGVNVYTNDPKPDGVVEGTNKYKNGTQYSSPLYIGKKDSTVKPYTPYVKSGRYNPYSKYY
ncbi:hypothetical protein FACS1894123_10360 [Bacteroidia bacterium]|nr:hypothetical protein FACS1894123_10360 [Bacteroidia bacterium]